MAGISDDGQEDHATTLDARIAACVAVRGTSLSLAVDSLDLVPDSVWDLTWLEELDLRHPSIAPGLGARELWELRAVPRAYLRPWRRLAKLKHLALQGVGLGDAHLEEIGQIASLRTLDCGANPITTIEAVRQLQQLTELSCHTTRVDSLEPLSALINLRKLDCSSTSVASLEPLRALTNLTKLSCSHAWVSSLEPLRVLTNLSELSCRQTAVAELQPLCVLANLRKLDCSQTLLSSLEPLRALVKLTILNCSSTYVASLEPLRALAKLSRLDCSFTQVSPLEPLGALTSLTTLDCSSTQVRSLEPLRALSDLSRLDCSQTKVSSLEPLRALTKLTTLDCNHTQVASLEPLTELTNLTDLNCSSTHVASLEPLRALSNLSSLVCSYTEVSSLEPLRALTKLSTLNCSSTRVSSLEPLRALSSLSTLDCGSNEVASLEALCALASLSTLYCSSTSVASLEPLRALTQLTKLYCSFTQVASLEPLRVLTKLTELRCGATQVASLEPLRALASLRSFFCTPLPLLREVPAEIVDGECSETLRGYWRDLDQGEAPERQARVLLVGNGYAGKTTLAHCLVYGRPPETPLAERTHAIVSLPLSLDGLEARLWDFAGQEIYHATHRLFLRARGLFLLLWTEDDPADPTPSDQRHPPGYWLDLIEWFGDGPILVAKNKVDALDTQPLPPELAERAPRIKAQLKVAARTQDGVTALRAHLQAELKKLVDARGTRIGASWVRLRAALAASSEKVLSHAAFLALAEEHDVLAPHALLTYLANTGEVFYAESAFGDHVFLDQSWLIDATYRIFDPRPGGAQRDLEQMQGGGEGTIRGETLRRNVWPGATEPEVSIYLSYLLASEIVFEVEPRQWGELAERRFVIPALLPEIDPLQWNQLVQRTRWELHLRFTFPMLHRALVERLLVRTASKNQGRRWWRNAAEWFDDETGCTVLLEAQPPFKRVLMRVAPTKAACGTRHGLSEAASKLILLMKEAGHQLGHTLAFSDAGEHFATLKALAQARKKNTPVACDVEGEFMEQTHFATTYRVIGQPVPERTNSGYHAAAAALPIEPSSHAATTTTTIILQFNEKAEVTMGDTYNTKTDNSPHSAIAVGPHATANAGVTGPTAGLDQAQHRRAVTKAQSALVEEQDEVAALGKGVYDALYQFLRIAREIQVNQADLKSTQAQMKDALDEVWAKNVAESLRSPILPSAWGVAKEIASNPVMQEVAKKLIGV